MVYLRRVYVDERRCCGVPPLADSCPGLCAARPARPGLCGVLLVSAPWMGGVHVNMSHGHVHAHAHVHVHVCMYSSEECASCTERGRPHGTREREGSGCGADKYSGLRLSAPACQYTAVEGTRAQGMWCANKKPCEPAGCERFSRLLLSVELGLRHSALPPHKRLARLTSCRKVLYMVLCWAGQPYRTPSSRYASTRDTTQTLLDAPSATEPECRTCDPARPRRMHPVNQPSCTQ